VGPAFLNWKRKQFLTEAGYCEYFGVFDSFEAAGDFSAHSLRSGFVTEAGRLRMDTADAMAMTGHHNYETFMGSICFRCQN
jgi:hypothetical protein